MVQQIFTTNKNVASHNFLKKGLLVSTLLLILGVSGYSQNIPLEEKHVLLNNYKTAVEDTINKRIEIDRPFVLGRMQVFHGTSVHHPYFSDYRPVNGSLVFKNKLYEADALLYDIHNDKLVYRYYSGNLDINNIALDENFVLGFTIHNSTFRYFKDLKTKAGRKLKDGYYEVVYDGTFKFLVRWEKTRSFDMYVSHKFSVSRRMYMLNDGQVVSIKNKWQLMNQFADKKREVKKFIKKNHIILELKNGSSVNEVFEYYESLLQ
jgi:hypothetical protein